MRKIESAFDDVEISEHAVASAMSDEPGSSAAVPATESKDVNAEAIFPSLLRRPDASYRRSLFRR